MKYDYLFYLIHYKTSFVFIFLVIEPDHHGRYPHGNDNQQHVQVQVVTKNRPPFTGCWCDVRYNNK